MEIHSKVGAKLAAAKSFYHFLRSTIQSQPPRENIESVQAMTKTEECAAGIPDTHSFLFKEQSRSPSAAHGVRKPLHGVQTY